MMMINKMSSSIYNNYWWKSLDTLRCYQLIKTCLKYPKFLIHQIRYKTLGIIVFYSPMSPYSLVKRVKPTENLIWKENKEGDVELQFHMLKRQRENEDQNPSFT